MQINTSPQSIYTHEGAIAKRTSAEEALRRTVSACLLWENTFYEDGKSVAERISQLVEKVDSNVVASIAIEAREQMKLRHVPLLLARCLAKKSYSKTADLLERIIQRPDELSEFMAIYWKEGRQPISSQVKKGLSRAFNKFSEYQLAKYNRKTAIRLKDILFLCHAKPKDDAQAETWKRLINDKMLIPDTWEVALSSGKDKTQEWTRLLEEDKLPAIAFLRNLRNMQNAGVPLPLIRQKLMHISVDRVLPFQFIAASRYAPDLNDILEHCMFRGA